MMLPIVILVVLTVTSHGAQGQQDIDAKFELLLDQIEKLKAETADNRARIDGLKTEFDAKEEALFAEIDELRAGCKDGTADGAPGAHRSQRAVSQTPVAFFAIAPDHDFGAMHAGTKLDYAPPSVNLGSAFHHASGQFIAPIPGVYVLFATVGGNNHAANYYYIEVGGAMRAKVLLTRAGPTQSSGTVVALLDAGDAVAVKAGADHDGAYGAYYTTIGGFLLYENVNPAPVGK